MICICRKYCQFHHFLQDLVRVCDYWGRKGSEKSEPFAFMAYYVYIIQSEVDKSFYKGFSENPAKRLLQHNEGATSGTRYLAPWKLIYVEEMLSKTDALVRERNLKKATRERILALLPHSKNIVSQFLEEPL